MWASPFTRKMLFWCNSSFLFPDRWLPRSSLPCLGSCMAYGWLFAISQEIRQLQRYLPNHQTKSTIARYWQNGKSERLFARCRRSCFHWWWIMDSSHDEWEWYVGRADNSDRNGRYDFYGSKSVWNRGKVFSNHVIWGEFNWALFFLLTSVSLFLSQCIFDCKNTDRHHRLRWLTMPSSRIPHCTKLNLVHIYI